MQFPQIFAETESKMLQSILGREKLLKKENDAHFDWGKAEFHMNLFGAARTGLTARGEQELVMEGESRWGVGLRLVGM